MFRRLRGAFTSSPQGKAHIADFICSLSLEQIDLLYENTVPYRAGPYRRHLLEDDVHAANEIRAHEKNLGHAEHKEDIEKASA